MSSQYRFRIDEVIEQIGEAAPLNKASWLEESWRDPDGFYAALCEYNAALRIPATKSNLASGFDIYHDAVLRHAQPGLERVALRTVSRERGQSSLTYADLDLRAGRLASLLRELGIQPAMPVCILLRFGESFVISLLAALRIGAIVSFVPPLGERYVTRRLQACKPALVITEKLYRRLCAPYKIVFHDDQGGVSWDARTHTYEPAAPMLMLPSPTHEPTWQPIKVSGATAYLRALRDGLCIYGLRAGDVVCAPGFDPLQHQPALLLATLLAGATFVDLEPAALAQDATLLQRLGVTCLGINNATRDMLRQAPSVPLGRLAMWFRSPLEPYDSETWRDLIARQGFGGIAAMNLHTDAALGGVVLFSARTKSKVMISPFVLPAPGVSYKLATVELSGQRAATSQGVYLQAGQKKEQGFLILARGGEGYFFVGPLTPRRSGRVFSAPEIKSVVAELPWVAGSAIIGLPDASLGNHFVFVLLIFLGGNAEPPTALAQLDQQITLQLSPDCVPDRIEIFPLYPRYQKGDDGPVTDENWCRSQYQAGSLQRKKQLRSMQLLTALRKACEDQRRLPVTDPE